MCQIWPTLAIDPNALWLYCNIESIGYPWEISQWSVQTNQQEECGDLPWAIRRVQT